MMIDSVKLVQIFVFLLFVNLSAVQSLSRADCRCRMGARRRIVGGQLAPYFVPWQIALFHSGDFTCSGVILNEDTIAIAQHCITGRSLINLKVVVGIVSLREIESQLIFDVSRSIKHPNFNERTLEKGHDIAILKLKKRIKFEIGKIEPACIKYQTSLVKDPITVAGFGVTEPVYSKNGLRSSKIPSNDLKSAEFKEHNGHWSKEIIDVQSIKANDSTCSGISQNLPSIFLPHSDGGSPVSITENGKILVIGLNSFTDIITRNGTELWCVGHGGFCRLSYERSFIEKNISKNEYCLV